MIQGTNISIALYLFLAGAGSGAYMIIQWMQYCTSHRFVLTERNSPSNILQAFPTVARLFSIALVLLGMLFLLTDLGVPSRLLLVLSRPFASAISFGAWSLALFIMFAVAREIVLTIFPNKLQKTKTTLSLLATLAALAVALYTGFYLYSVPTIAFWHTFLIVVLFLASALSSGTAVLITLTFFLARENRLSLLRTLGRLDIIIIIVELALLAAFLTSRYYAGPFAQQFVLSLLIGTHQYLFWCGVVGFGIIAPLILGFLAPRTTECYLMAAGCIIIGGLLLRCSIILI